MKKSRSTGVTWIRLVIMIEATAVAAACGPVVRIGHNSNDTQTSTTQFELDKSVTRREVDKKENEESLPLVSVIQASLGEDIGMYCTYYGDKGRCHCSPASNLVWRYQDRLLDKDTAAVLGHVSVKNLRSWSYFTIHNVTSTSYGKVECLRLCGIDRYCLVQRFLIRAPS
ncbi:uncharacterized protein LOC129588007 [Paramacrobiotus metropolitanus]|uniref:uncharacterized protein LOC129588007 n=1 Tax=Paramacrobiotus metropolitanus TaxID=2943436 RepID=UPI002445EEC0|nr:uncharacterized protein LOC129588007 [Paramacrobiotus metropolitanus]